MTNNSVLCSVAVDQQPAHGIKVVAGKEEPAGCGIFSAVLQKLQECQMHHYLVDRIRVDRPLSGRTAA